MSDKSIAIEDSYEIKKLSWRSQIAFYLEDTETNIGLWCNLLVLGLILLSSAIFTISTYPIGDRYQRILQTADTIILFLFAVEYILRLWSAEDRQKFFFSFFSAIDLIAILPLLIGWIDIRFIRIFRWFRILRIVRFWRAEQRLLGLKSEDSVVFVRIFLTLFTIIFVYAGLIYQIEYQINSDRLHNFFDAFYFVVVTMTTVGYGDVTPLSQAGRIMTLLMIFTGVLFIPWQFGELIKQVVKTSGLVEQTSSVEQKCTNCNLSRHDADAVFCKQCGARLPGKN